MTRQLTAVASAAVAIAFYAQAAQDPAEAFYSGIRNNDIASVRTLAKTQGVNTRDSRGAHPLMFAAGYGTTEMMEMLIAAGADVNAANTFGETPLMWAAYDLKKTRLLLVKGAAVDARSKIGRTALTIAAAKNGNSETVKLLLGHGADPTVSDSQKTTALQLAANASDLATVKLLLAKHADPQAQDQFGLTALIFAAANDNPAMIQTLLARGGGVNVTSAEKVAPPVKAGEMALGNFTALQFAATSGSPESVRLLLDAGATVNAPDVRGMSPLMLAVATDHADARIVRLLLARGADLAQKDKGGESASDWARKYASPEILQALKIGAIDPAAHLEPASASDLSARTAAERSLALLERTGVSFGQGGACSSCHAQNLTAMSRASLQKSGVLTSAEAAEGTLKGTAGMWTYLGTNLLQRMDPPGGPEMVAYGLFDFAAHAAPAGRLTDPMVRNLLDSQRREGNWHLGGIMRAPIEDGDFSRTAMAVRSLRLYAPAGLKAQSDLAVGAAARWLVNAAPQTTEDRTMQLLGLVWAQSGGPVVKSRLLELQNLQRPDGGWAQTPNLETDAYATGQALYTLHECGVKVDSATFQQGVKILLSTQEADGSWHVKSRSTRIQPYFQSGFPYDHDQWISSAATAWAAMALSYTVGPDPAVTRASR